MKALFGLSHSYRRSSSTAWFSAGFASCALCAVSPALATTLQCNPAQTVVGSPETAPQYAVAGTMVEFGATGWRVEHRLANGRIAARNSQYTMWDASTNHSTEWRGRYTHNPKLLMIGEVVDSGFPAISSTKNGFLTHRKVIALSY
jgi:hypothetical protein